MKPGWRATQLGDLVNFVGGGTPSRDNSFGGRRPPLQIAKPISSQLQKNWGGPASPAQAIRSGRNYRQGFRAAGQIRDPFLYRGRTLISPPAECKRSNAPPLPRVPRRLDSETLPVMVRDKSECTSPPPAEASRSRLTAGSTAT